MTLQHIASTVQLRKLTRYNKYTIITWKLLNYFDYIEKCSYLIKKIIWEIKKKNSHPQFPRFHHSFFCQDSFPKSTSPHGWPHTPRVTHILVQQQVTPRTTSGASTWAGTLNTLDFRQYTSLPHTPRHARSALDQYSWGAAVPCSSGDKYSCSVVSDVMCVREGVRWEWLGARVPWVVCSGKTSWMNFFFLFRLQEIPSSNRLLTDIFFIILHHSAQN